MIDQPKRGPGRPPSTNRMADPMTRQPQPAERVLVTPPPESVLKCPHCGAARIKGMITPGSQPRGGDEHRKVCRSCGVKLLFSSDYRLVRVIG
jgi:hypothetical protein